MHSRLASPPRLTQAPSSTPGTARLDWDDLRYVLAVARAGSLSGAARALAVTHSTVLRRVDAIEEKLMVRLFERLRSGYVPTEAGETLRRAAEECEPRVAQAEREIIGGDTRLTGRLRVTTAHVVALYLLPPALAVFHAQQPRIEVEVRTARERVDLARREADVALRMSAEAPDSLVGRSLGTVRIRVYGWRGAPYLEGRAGAKPRGGKALGIDTLAREFPWIGFDGQDRIYDRWLDATVPAPSVVVRADHFPSALALLRTGMGITVLPEFVAREFPDLLPLSAPIDELKTPFWILTHADLRNTARVRAFMQTIGGELARVLASG